MLLWVRPLGTLLMSFPVGLNCEAGGSHCLAMLYYLGPFSHVFHFDRKYFLQSVLPW